MLQRSQFFWLVAACLLSTLVSGQEATESLAEAPAQEAVMFEVRELDPMATVTDNMSVVSGAAAPVEERAPQEQIPEQPLEQLPETTTCDTPAPSSRLEILLVPGLVLLNTYDLLHIGEGLQRKGHTVTALVPDTLLKNAEEPLPSLNYFTYGSVQLQQYDNYGDVFHDLTTRLEFMLSNCASVMSNRTLVERLRDQKYNLLLGDSSDLCIQLLSQKLTAPYVAYDSAGAFSLTQGILSQMQYPLVTIPAYGSGLAGGIGGPMPIKDRLKNVVQHVRLQWWYKHVLQAKLTAFRQRYRVPEHAACPGPVLTITGADWGFIEPQPISPTVKMVGPIEAWPEADQSALTPALAKFLEGAEHGVVVISLPQRYRLQLRAQMAIAESVLDLKQRVVWELPAHEHSKVLATYLPLQHSTSILVLPTIPINALLAHPKVVSVVSDGSIQAIYRAIYYAKPIASVALTVEQRDLVARVDGLGIGRGLDREELESGAASFRISIAIERMSNVYSYSERIQALSRQLKALPLGTSAERAAMWIEYAAAASSANGVPLMASTACMGWFAAHNADAWAVCVGVIAAWCLLCAYVWHICTRMPTPQKPAAHAHAHAHVKHVEKPKDE